MATPAAILPTTLRTTTSSSLTTTATATAAVATTTLQQPRPFLPRTTLPPYTLPKSYYLGHHAAGLAKMKQLLASNVSLVLECRDYRIPLTSRNPLLEEALMSSSSGAGERRRRVVVYTKRDLGADVESRGGVAGRAERAIRGLDGGRDGARRGGRGDADTEADANAESTTTTFFHTTTGTGNRRHSNTPALLSLIKSHARSHFSLTGTRVLVAGMPNVGKSTLLNALRSAGGGGGGGGGAGGDGRKKKKKTKKAAVTGGMPGVTRSVGSAVKILEGWEVDGLDGPPSASSSVPPTSSSPTIHSTSTTTTTTISKSSPKAAATASASATSEPVYIHDTPGVFMPYVPSALSMLKLALCGCVKDGLVPPLTVADYLLYELNLRDPGLYLRLLRPKVPKPPPDEGPATTSTTAAHEKQKSREKQKQQQQDQPQSQPQLQPTNSIIDLLTRLAKRTGRLSKGGEPDLESTAVWFVQQWRRGELGRFVLDDVLSSSSSESLKEEGKEHDENGEGKAVMGNGARGGIVIEEAMVSVSQARKAEKARRREMTRARGRRKKKMGVGGA